MHRSRLTSLVVAVWCAAHAPSGLAAQERAHGAHGAHGPPRLGTITFANSGAPAAQAPFLRGVALLHSFEYDDAAEAFREAQRADPAFALAYWLEALTYSHPQWGEDDPAAAHRVLARLAPSPAARLARAPTPRERAYGAAVEAYYADLPLPARARAFADSMHALASRAPDDAEAAAFASVAAISAALLGPPGERAAAQERAVSHAERVFAANADHPGAAHYLIHVSDLDASFATRALPAARAYAAIAPDAEHALHMPSHVFLKLGMWDEVAASNERAWAASRAWVARRGLGGADASYHALAWLQYGYLQQGRWRAARALIDTARAALAGADLAAASHVDARYALAELEFAYAAETGRWFEVRVAGPTEMSAAGGPSAARETAFLMRARYQRAAAALSRGDASAAAAAALPPATGGGALRSLYALGLDALGATVRGDRAAALEALRRAGDHEDRVPLIGPPSYLSAHEALGALLLADGKPADAAAAYARALAHAPNRSSALLGLARARAAAGDAAGAREAYARLRRNWVHADPDLPALTEVKKGGA